MAGKFKIHISYYLDGALGLWALVVQHRPEAAAYISPKRPPPCPPWSVVVVVAKRPHEEVPVRRLQLQVSGNNGNNYSSSISNLVFGWLVLRSEAGRNNLQLIFCACPPRRRCRVAAGGSVLRGCCKPQLFLAHTSEVSSSSSRSSSSSASSGGTCIEWWMDWPPRPLARSEAELLVSLVTQVEALWKKRQIEFLT